MVHANSSSLGKIGEYITIINDHEDAFQTKYNDEKVKESTDVKQKEKETKKAEEGYFVSKVGAKREGDTIGDILNKGKDGKKQKFSEKEKEKKGKEDEQREGGHD